MDYVFDRDLLRKQMMMESRYSIGVDVGDEESAYCLIRSHRNFGTGSEVVLCNVQADRVSFEEEVRNLAKYFDAEIIGEL